MTKWSSYHMPSLVPSLYPSFGRRSCEPCCPPPCPPPCPPGCELTCAKRLNPCCVPPVCICGRCDVCRARRCAPSCELRGVQLSVVDVDCCGNLILCVKRPKECWCNGEMRPCRDYR